MQITPASWPMPRGMKIIGLLPCDNLTTILTISHQILRRYSIDRALNLKCARHVARISKQTLVRPRFWNYVWFKEHQRQQSRTFHRLGACKRKFDQTCTGKQEATTNRMILKSEMYCRKFEIYG